MNGKGMTPTKGYNHPAYRDNYDTIFMSNKNNNLVMGHAAFVPTSLREALQPTLHRARPVRATPAASAKGKPTVTPRAKVKPRAVVKRGGTRAR